jgi:hypothetical protein
MIVRLGKLAALDARIALVERIIGITAHRRYAITLDIGEHGAIGVAETTECRLGNNGHRVGPLVTNCCSGATPIIVVRCKSRDCQFWRLPVRHQDAANWRQTGTPGTN